VAGALGVLPELSLDASVEFPLTTHGRAAERLVLRAQEA